jgi:hypothetical protein
MGITRANISAMNIAAKHCETIFYLKYKRLGYFICRSVASQLHNTSVCLMFNIIIKNSKDKEGYIVVIKDEFCFMFCQTVVPVQLILSSCFKP